jgi:hypothetical protein
MTEDEIIGYARSLPGTAVVAVGEESGGPEAARGDSFFFHDPESDGPEARRFPFATIVTHDYAGFDTASRPDRPGVRRLDIAVGRKLFGELLGHAPGAAPADPPRTATDRRFLPHPVYAAQGWVSVLSPAGTCGERARDLLAAAHERALRRHR